MKLLEERVIRREKMETGSGKNRKRSEEKKTKGVMREEGCTVHCIELSGSFMCFIFTPSTLY